ncbi:DNA repair protein RecO [Endozoicomonas gorgoniicola]|uniref:DNA repair protein RecO n=1 Tax=Endozoicomonas gorgoniicola TaxID=1234144 RepID=A0ABT3MRM2_9GAMM|nr:DNA repair protein RecO [Endozoicomonas gorgoniicola]MCW7552023.1 DNA repair protein RecO [Endozoicomonas gorgoniicola]
MNDLSAAWLLHSRPYKERSVIAEFLVEDYGRLAMVVRGVRQAKSRIAPLLQPFTRVWLSWRGRSELKTLTSIELSRSIRLSGQSLYCGFYVNELVMRAVLPGQPMDGLPELYEKVIEILQGKEAVEPVLRWFELELLELTGYLPDLEHDITTGQAVQSDANYRLLPEQGLVRLNDDMPVKVDCFSGAALQAMAARDFTRGQCLPSYKRFTRLALLPLIGEKPLQSRELFTKMDRRDTVLSE